MFRVSPLVFKLAQTFERLLELSFLSDLVGFIGPIRPELAEYVKLLSPGFKLFEGLRVGFEEREDLLLLQLYLDTKVGCLDLVRNTFSSPCSVSQDRLTISSLVCSSEMKVYISSTGFFIAITKL